MTTTLKLLMAEATMEKITDKTLKNVENYLELVEENRNPSL